MENGYFYSNHNGTESEYNNKKIVLNNKNDLINIPIQQLRTAQLKNFCGSLFDQLYKEAMIIEHNQDMKINKSISSNIPDNNIKLKNDNLKMPRKNDVKSKTVQIKKNNIKTFEKKKKSTSAERKVVIKIIKKKVKTKKLHESDSNVKTRPQLISSTIIYKNITTNKFITDNNNTNNNNYIPYYHSMNVKMDDDLNNNNLIINKIIFSIKYDTTFGEEVGILGSIHKLGNWNQGGIFYLKWNNGNIWTGEIDVESNPPIDFEFKFVISSNRKVKRWENGENNKVNFDKLLNEIKYKKNGFFNKYEYRYDSTNNELYLKCKWD